MSTIVINTKYKLNDIYIYIYICCVKLYFVLCFVVWCFILRCVALRCVALRCLVLCCVVLCCVVLCCVVLLCCVLYCILCVVCCVLCVVCCVVLYCIVLCYFVLYCITLYCIVLYCIVLCCIVLYCIKRFGRSHLTRSTHLSGSENIAHINGLMKINSFFRRTRGSGKWATDILFAYIICRMKLKYHGALISKLLL